jgi:hypothetical protein
VAKLPTLYKTKYKIALITRIPWVLFDDLQNFGNASRDNYQICMDSQFSMSFVSCPVLGDVPTRHSSPKTEVDCSQAYLVNGVENVLQRKKLLGEGTAKTMTLKEENKPLCEKRKNFSTPQKTTSNLLYLNQTTFMNVRRLHFLRQVE